MSGDCLRRVGARVSLALLALRSYGGAGCGADDRFVQERGSDASTPDGAAGSNGGGSDASSGGTAGSEAGGTAGSEAGGSAGSEAGGTAGTEAGIETGGSAGTVGSTGGMAGIGGCVPVCDATKPICANGVCVECAASSAKCSGDAPVACESGKWVTKAACGGRTPVCSNGICAGARFVGGITTVAAAVLKTSTVRLVDHGFGSVAATCATVKGSRVCMVGGVRP